MKRFLSFKYLAFCSVAIIVVAILWSALTFRSAQGRIGTLRSLSTQISTDIDTFRANPSTPGMLDSVEADLLKFKAELTRTRRDFKAQLFAARFLGWLPSLGDDLSALSPLLDAGSEATEAGTGLITTARRAMSVAPTLVPTQSQPGESLDNILKPSRQGLLEAQARLSEAKKSLSRVDSKNLRPELQSLTDKLTGAIDQVDPLVNESLTALDIAAQMTEAKGEKRFLLAAQNADELRATGGFIPGAWLIRIADGRIQPFIFYDSPNVDDLSKQYPTPPEWLGKTLWGGIWVFRDAFWNPNFPDSAQAAEDLFLLGKGLEVDGVIAFDQWLLPPILKATGPIVIDGLKETVTDSNVSQIIRRETDEQGRAYVNVIMQELLKVTQGQADSSRLAGLAFAVKQMLTEKHLLVYLNDQVAQSKILVRNWGGSLSQKEGDYLIVNDSNVGYNKVNANIVESIDYSVLLSEGIGNLAKLQIDYQNRSGGFSPECVQGVPLGNPPYEEASQGCYWDYLRVYIPQNASPMAWPSFPLPPGSLYAQNDPFHDKDTYRVFTESNKMVLSGLNVVPQRAVSTLVFSYALPDNIVKTQNGQAQYTLNVQKQAGTVGHSFRFSISYPKQWQLQSSNLQPSRTQPGKAEFNLTLTADMEINLTFTTP